MLFIKVIFLKKSRPSHGIGPDKLKLLVAALLSFPAKHKNPKREIFLQCNPISSYSEASSIEFNWAYSQESAFWIAANVNFQINLEKSLQAKISGISRACRCSIWFYKDVLASPRGYSLHQVGMWATQGGDVQWGELWHPKKETSQWCTLPPGVICHWIRLGEESPMQ